MKRILPFLLVLCILLGGCSTAKTNDKLKITTTVFPAYDFLREIAAGVDAELNMLIAPGMEVHGFETTLEDIALVSSSDLFVCVGGEDDEWVENIPETETKIVTLSSMVGPCEDDHYWTSPKNAITITEKLCENLCDVDPENAATYKENTQKYIEELKKLDSGFAETVKNGKTNTVVFAERFPFYHMANDYGLEYHSAFEGCSTETEAGIKVINQLIETIEKENISVVFTIEFSDNTVADRISSETGAQVLLMHSCHNVTEEEFESGETYLSLMTKNLENLKIALG
ncbi:MAG: zinc ABC transporter substrate-binding protein [Ruminococcaceae bacterium]|nr:zinc ABC transporter substrate-binding protein [Oscillospiraceae bacterium]